MQPRAWYVVDIEDIGETYNEYDYGEHCLAQGSLLKTHLSPICNISVQMLL